ncbi:MAG TPA: hypothetical protein VM716_01135 [Gemmatimonadales bacterium]|nr:hypothetical protein [Gemmatimonadales bacterium]
MTAPHASKEKPGWPLLVVACCSVIPVLGILFAAAAIPWGLVSRRPRARLAAAIGAAGFFVNFAGGFLLVLKSVRDPTVATALASGQARTARQDLAKLIAAIDDYHARTGQYPPNLLVLVGPAVPLRFLNISDQTSGIFSFPPRLYQYTVASDQQSYDVFAVGPDGLPRTADDIRAELPDSIRRHSGYRPAQ